MSESRDTETLRAAATALDARLGDHQLVGVGWATVDLERSIEMARAEDGSAWAAADRDGLLGARSARSGRWARSAPSDGRNEGESVEVVLLEPDTEGLLAATLARFGEGLAVAWFAPLAGDAGRRSAVGETPFGPGRLVLGGPRWGPYAIVLEPPARADS